MPVPILKLVLTVEERRGEEEPSRVARYEWGADDLPSRSYFKAAIEVAYASIELPCFPFAAWVEVTTESGSHVYEAGEPQDQELVGPVLWNAVVVAATGYDS